MKIFTKITSAFVMVALAQTPTPVRANEDMIGALIGGMIGAAISQSGNVSRSAPVRTVRPSRSSAEIAEARQVQESLNYFGFNAGVVDGVIGRGTRSAIARYQTFMGYPASGNLQPHEKNFLFSSYTRAINEPPAIIRQAMATPMGLGGLLRQYAQPQPPVPPAVVAVPSVSAPVATASTTVMVQNGLTDEVAATLQEEVNSLSEQIALLRAVIEHQQTEGDTPQIVARIGSVRRMLDSYSSRIAEIEEISNDRYSTPIRPNNQNLGVTARRLSEIFPKVPYYIAGTEEIGEMWVEPIVTDSGQLQFSFNFIDPDAQYDVVRDSIAFASQDIDAIATALTRIDEMTTIAQENGVRRNFARRVICLPEGLCDQRVEGTSSSEVIFQIYEDGSTAARIQRNRGAFSSGYNMSVESSLLLAAYLDYMHDVGMRDFISGSMTDEDLNALFD